VFLGLLFVVGVVDSFNWGIFSWENVFLRIFFSVLWLGWGVFQGWLVSRLFGLGGGVGFVLVFGVLVDGV